jgi:hypothetical protein
LKDGTRWLDALKKNVEKKPTEAHTSVALGSADPANTYSKVLVGHPDKTDRRLSTHNEQPASAALLSLFAKDSEWESFFRSCCEMSTQRLIAQAWQLRNELKERGHPFPAGGVEDALLGLARELLPESAAAEWDADWAHGLCKDALSRLAVTYDALSAEEKEALDLSAQHEWDKRMATASLGNDPAAFRAALKGWERTGLEAMNRARMKGGAA